MLQCTNISAASVAAGIFIQEMHLKWVRAEYIFPNFL
jgi:hypothetical protein